MEKDGETTGRRGTVEKKEFGISLKRGVL